MSLLRSTGACKNLSGYEYLEFMAKFTTHNKEIFKETVEVAAETSGLAFENKKRKKQQQAPINIKCKKELKENDIVHNRLNKEAERERLIDSPRNKSL